MSGHLKTKHEEVRDSMSNLLPLASEVNYQRKFHKKDIAKDNSPARDSLDYMRIEQEDEVMQIYQTESLFHRNPS